MAKCHENRRRRERNRRREMAMEHRTGIPDRTGGWQCGCGNFIPTWGCHCWKCGETPYGCPCASCQDIRDHYFDEYPEGDDPDYEPVGSCEWCGESLFEDDDDDLCEQCLWNAEQNKGGESLGFQPIM